MQFRKVIRTILLGAVAATAASVQVDDFWVQALPRQIQGQWWYWVGANITLPSLKSTSSCYGWQTTGSGSATAITQGIPPTTCTSGPAGLSWSFDVTGGSPYGYGQQPASPSYAYSVYYTGPLGTGKLEIHGTHDVSADDISTGVDEGVTVAYFSGQKRSFVVPVLLG